MHATWIDTLTRSVRWQDIVDVLLLTLLFSGLYRLMRRTVALQVALGLLALLLSSWVASRFGLILTSYLLSAVSAAAAVIVVVVFQRELRMALGRANPFRWLSRRSPPPATRALVAEAAFAVARHGKGALIVVPRRDPIFERATSGTLVDARLSADLIEAIFTSSSPLHDGAVVVSHERVVRAGVVLPLATEGYEGRGGTRHRAALGLARSTDALVVCVSEEEGTVSLVHEDAIEPMSDAGLLQTALHRLGADRARGRGPRPGPRRLRPWRALPYLAIFAAVSVGWGVLALDQSNVVARVVPLELRGLGESLATDPLRPTTVTLELRSSSHELELLAADAVRAYVNLGGAKLGWHRYHVQTDSPPGIKVSGMAPTVVQLQIRPRADRPRTPAFRARSVTALATLEDPGGAGDGAFGQ